MNSQAMAHVTEAHKHVQASTVSSGNNNSEKGFVCYIFMMAAVMKSMSTANKGNAAVLNAQSAQAQQVAEEYNNAKAIDLNGAQSEGAMDAQTILMQQYQNDANKLQQNMGLDANAIAYGETGIQTAAGNAQTLVEVYSKVGRTK